MSMTWYIAPRYCREAELEVTVTGEAVQAGDSHPREECPGTGDPVHPYRAGMMRCYAYDAANGTVLVGFLPGHDNPAPDWTRISTDEAREHYRRHYGREPGMKQVPPAINEG